MDMQEIKYWKLPPPEKIYEALSVLADGRYTMEAAGKVTVTSSGGDKKYMVRWKEEDTAAGQVIMITSNDNASFWQGYTGYPIIAVLMIIKKITFDSSLLLHFQGVSWNEINKRYRNDYAKAADEVLSKVDEDAVQKIKSEVGSIYRQIEGLKPARMPGRV
jgi:hypothetical protein